METMEPSGHEEDTSEHRVSQTVPKLEVLECLYPKEAEATDKSKE